MSIFRRRRQDDAPPAPRVTADVQYIQPYASQALIHDGWEHANAYHYMMAAADNVRFVVVLPQHKLAGETVMYHRGYDETMWSLIDVRRTVRTWGFLGFVLGGAKCAEMKIEATREAE